MPTQAEIEAAQRKYSVSEIDRMREAIDWTYPTTGFGYRAVDRNADIENRLRTHMLNGTEPKELEDAIPERTRAYIEAIRAGAENADAS